MSESGATFSPCRQYRYVQHAGMCASLGRRNEGRPAMSQASEARTRNRKPFRLCVRCDRWYDPATNGHPYVAPCRRCRAKKARQ